jgi:L-lysine exporter family protein LysE/ArgO
MVLGMGIWFSGLLLGLALIMPIGPQNLFVLNQGLRVGFPRALAAVLATGACDTFLIVLGAVGAAKLLAAAPGLREALILLGVTFLVVLGLSALLRHSEGAEDYQASARLTSVGIQAAGVSLLNPHAVLDTVGVIGGAVAAQAAQHRLTFALGAVSASYLWFFLLAIFASALKSRLTIKVRLWIQRGSGLLMLIFAGILASELM